MKILYILQTFPKLSETFILNQMTGLIDRGHDIEILAERVPLEEESHEDVLRYDLLRKTQYIHFKNDRTFLDVSNAKKLVTSFDADLIHTHFAVKPADIAFEIFTRIGIPFIITAHAYDIFINPDVTRLKAKFLASKRVITCSQFNKNYLLTLLGKEFDSKIVVNPYGINLSRFNYRERKGDDRIRILYVGRLVEKKGILDGIAAFQQVHKKRPFTELRVIGNGPLLEQAKDRVEETNLTERVHFLGGLTQEKVITEMENADIFLLPSKKAPNGDCEGLPVVILEAQAMGLPVVSTIHTGIPEEVLDGETGILVQEGDVLAMGEGLLKLIESPGLRHQMGKAGRKWVETRFDLGRELHDLETIMMESVAGEKTFLEKRLTIFFPQLLENLQEQISKQAGQIHNLQSLQEQVSQHSHQIQNLQDQMAHHGHQIQNLKDQGIQDSKQIYKFQEFLNRIKQTLVYRFLKKTKELMEGMWWIFKRK